MLSTWTQHWASTFRLLVQVEGTQEPCYCQGLGRKSESQEEVGGSRGSEEVCGHARNLGLILRMVAKGTGWSFLERISGLSTRVWYQQAGPVLFLRCRYSLGTLSPQQKAKGLQVTQGQLQLQTPHF